MNPETIFLPVTALALWTGFILAITGYRRISAVVAKRLRQSDFRLSESSNVPENIVVCNRNLMNLLEMPVLFYVVSLSLYVTRHVDATVVALAWLYLGL